MARTPSILAAYEDITVSEDLAQGVTVYNISRRPDMLDTEQMLLQNYTVENGFNTIFGKVYDISRVMQYLSTPGFDASLLHVKKLNSKQLKSIPYKRVTVPNYWSILVHVVWERLYQDEELRFLATSYPEIFLTSYKMESKDYYGSKFVLKSYNKKMIRYIGTIRAVLDTQYKLYQDGKLEDTDAALEAMLALMLEAKDKPDQGVFDGLPFEIYLPDNFRI